MIGSLEVRHNNHDVTCMYWSSIFNTFETHGGFLFSLKRQRNLYAVFLVIILGDIFLRTMIRVLTRFNTSHHFTAWIPRTTLSPSGMLLQPAQHPPTGLPGSSSPCCCAVLASVYAKKTLRKTTQHK